MALIQFENLPSTNTPINANNLNNNFNFLDNKIGSYSTNEVQTNMTWVDGRPIYRKVLTGTTTTAGSLAGVTITTNLQNIIRVDGFVGLASGNYLPIAYSNTGAPIFYFIDSNSLYLQVGNSAFENKDFYAIVEYTKSTD